MKILFVTSTLSSGGSERVMSILANELAVRNHQVEIICINRHVVFYPIINRIKIVFIEEEVGTTFIAKKMLWLRKYIIREKPDVVVPFMTDVYSVTLLSLLGIKVPKVSSERVDPRYSNWLYTLLRWVFVPLTTHLVVQTERIKEYFPRFVRNKTSVIYNPVSENVFNVETIEKQDIIISLGRLAKQKNFPMMIRSFAAIANDFPTYQLHIYGEGPCREELQEEINKLGMSDRIFLFGRTSDAVDKLNQARLFCMSTNGEGMSNALIEAICVGLPVLTTHVSGAEELIENGFTGYITPIGDESSFTNALKKLLSNVALMQDMGERNRNKRKMFRQAIITDQWEELFKKIVSDEK